MYLSGVHRSISQAHDSNAFQLSPVAFAIVLTQARQVADRTANCDWFDVVSGSPRSARSF
jgi:hypothetical protein